MTYFIDFDHTIFDTTAFKKERGFLRTFAKFAPDELKKYLYPDVPAFLEMHARDTVIVTYGIEAFIMAKVTNALNDFPLKRIVYTFQKKGHVMEKLTAEMPGPWKFIDDAVFQLESVAKHCPQGQLFEMRREEGEGDKGDGRWPVIHSLADVSLDESAA